MTSSFSLSLSFSVRHSLVKIDTFWTTFIGENWYFLDSIHWWKLMPFRRHSLVKIDTFRRHSVKIESFFSVSSKNLKPRHILTAWIFSSVCQRMYFEFCEKNEQKCRLPDLKSFKNRNFFQRWQKKVIFFFAFSFFLKVGCVCVRECQHMLMELEGKRQKERVCERLRARGSESECERVWVWSPA